MNELPSPGGENMEKRAILATVLALIVLLVYYAFFMPTPPPPPVEPERKEAKQGVVEEAMPPVAATTPEPVETPQRITGPLRRGEREEEIVLETDLLRVVLSNRGGGVRSWQLKRYEETAGPVDLVGSRPDGAAPLPFATSIHGGEGHRGLYRIVARPPANSSGPQRVVMEFQEANGILVQKTLVLHPDRYLADAEVRLKNLGKAAARGSLRLQWGPGFRLGTEDQVAGAAAPAVWIDGKLENPEVEEGRQEVTQSGTIGWTALQDRYFAAALIPDGADPSGFVAKDAEGRPVVGLLYPSMKIAPGAEQKVEMKLYAGPKEIVRLREAGRNLGELVYLGWFDFVARPALYFLQFLYGFIGNYGVAIIVITVLQKIVFYPLTQKSHKSMQAMQQLQPKIQALKERHKNNPQKVNQETMELYKKHGVNPFGGCLPMLIQIPIFIALYNALASSVELWHAPFALWITDLSAPDTLFSIPIAGDAFAVRALALIMGISMFIQQKMSPTGGDPRQAKMMLYMMPIMFTFIFWGMPSGLVLYWLVNNVLQIGHQYHMNRGLKLLPATGKQTE
ncbi:MAG: membrane protein insertase YidC [Candidatus Methylomirabilales bacterium]